MTPNCELNIPLPKRKNKTVTGVMKDELGRKTMKELLGLRAKSYSCLIEDGSDDKKAKRTKKCIIKRKINNKNCLEETQLENKINHIGKKKEIDADTFTKDHQEFLKSNKLISKVQQEFKSERHVLYLRN